jgi:2-polyprenyl-6-methoxyphenol hydroxylase-like FAD-dependent oxidoreductase
MHALIIGGGIAGPVTAMALQRVGIRATISEAHPAADPDAGSYLTVTANGLEGLSAIGALDIATEAGFPTRRNVLWNQAGRRLVTVPLDSTLAGSPPALTIKRSRLAHLLQEEAIRRGIEIGYGRRLTGADSGQSGQLVATFEDGHTTSGDLLIGADGVRSVVRKLIDPTAPQGRYVGLTNFGGVTTGAAEGLEPDAWHLIFGRRAFFGYQTTPEGDVVWFANVPRTIITSEERSATTPEQWRGQLMDLFNGDVGPAVDLIGAGELELAADNTHDLAHVPVWHRGSMVIIGDAAHAPAPTSGQGASMAIEDGIVLARELSSNPSISDAFAEYEKARRDRVEKIVAWGARGSSNKAPGRFGRLARDLMLSMFVKRFVTEESLAWMYDYRVSLPERSVAGWR